MRRNLHVFLLLVLLIGVNQVAVGQDTNSLTAKIDSLFSPWDKHTSPGCALGIIKDGQHIYTRGYGMADLEHDLSISSKSVFYIGSTSKQFVTFSILLLAAEQLLSIDEDIRKYIPEFPEYDKPITIRHLIHHTSGIRDYLTLWRLSGRDYLDYMPEDAVLNMICNQKELNFTPGTQYLYSNSCYFLLSVIVNRVSGKSLREFAQQNIFEPLGMNSSHFHDDNGHIIKNRAFGYMQKDDGSFRNLIMRFDLVGSGGLYTTVDDLFLWNQNFYQNKLAGGQSIIRTMLTNGRFSNGEEVDYAFALRNDVYRGAKTVSHGGALAGYRAQLLRFPQHRFSVIILSNLANFNPTQMAYKVADVYLAEHLTPVDITGEPDVEAKLKEPAFELTSEKLNEFVGDYYSDELETIYKITSESGQLFVQVGQNPKIALEGSAKDTFSRNFTIRFQRDGKQRVSGFRVNAGRVTNLKFARRN